MPEGETAGADHAAGTTRQVRDKAWWLDRLEACAWIVLIVLWTVIAVWVVRLGEPTSLGWVVMSGVHLLLLAAWPVAIVGLVLRRRALAGAAIATIAVQLVVAWPLLPHPGDDDARGKPITIGSWNAFVDNDQLDEAAQQLADDPPDVLVLQEFTPGAKAAFRRAGLETTYPYRIDRSEEGTTGEAVYSRYPVEPMTPPPAPMDDVLLATVRLPNGRQLDVADVHAFGPQPGDSGVWERTLHQLDRTLDEVKGPWVALGDLNATSDHRVFLDLLHDGRRDAHQATGRGYARTWPAGTSLPPLLLIDHAVLSPSTRAAATRERTIAGSDHRMIEVDVTV